MPHASKPATTALRPSSRWRHTLDGLFGLPIVAAFVWLVLAYLGIA